MSVPKDKELTRDTEYVACLSVGSFDWPLSGNIPYLSGPIDPDEVPCELRRNISSCHSSPA